MLAGAVGMLVPLTAGAADRDAKQRTHVVLYERGASDQSARAAVEGAGGQLLAENHKIGLATVRSANADFVTDVARSAAVAGAARNRPLGQAPAGRAKDPFALERMTQAARQAEGEGEVRDDDDPEPPDEPFAALQWNMRMINATSAKSYSQQRGNHGVRVGIIDTGVDASHPDIAPNFNSELSRNFTTDDPLVDGPARRIPTAPATTPRTWTRTATARTWPASQARRSTASASPAWRPTSRS
jgi:subtilisin family serine protease